MANTDDVARVARQAGEAGDLGHSSVVINYIRFNLKERGYCARFVRQVHEAATGCGVWNWKYNAASARAMEAKLKADHCAVTTNPVPGDIIAVNGGAFWAGHIGVYIGNGLFAENTSSKVRGPGTTISRVADVANRVTGYYRAVTTASEDPAALQVILYPPTSAHPYGEVIDCTPEIIAGVTRGDVTPLAGAMGYRTHYDSANRKVYLIPQED